MSISHYIKVSPSILLWARTSIGYSVEEAAQKANVKPQKILDWEKGASMPTYVQLENLAYTVYKRPLAVFFKKSPPIEEPINKDFRNISSSEANSLSSEMRLALRKAKRLQHLIEELEDEEETTLKKYKEFTVSVDDDPVTAAVRFRNFIGLTIEKQQKWNRSNSLQNFISLIEDIGIYVFQLPMPVQEARAFSLTDDNPVIILNTNDAKNGRIFSLFHEVCHILFNMGGVFKDKETKQIQGEYKTIEYFCHRFAASVLVPDKEFKVVIDYQSQVKHDWAELDLERLAQKFSVSKEVILRKLVSINLASEAYLFRLKRKWDAQYAIDRDLAKNKTKDSGKPPIIPQDIKIINEKGRKYVSKVVDMFDKGKIGYGEVSEYLETKLDHLGKIIERLNR